MKSNEDWAKLAKARALSAKMLKEILSVSGYGKTVPVYFDNLIARRLKIDYLIIDLKYK